MKMSKHDRKIFNQGKAVGYAEGYAQGLHDGNPINRIAEALQEMVKRVSDILNNPELTEALVEAREMQERLEAEGCDSISGDDSLESENQEEQSTNPLQ